jgi:hypothetical protein
MKIKVIRPLSVCPYCGKLTKKIFFYYHFCEATEHYNTDTSQVLKERFIKNKQIAEEKMKLILELK